MNNLRDEKLVTIYVGENSRVDGKPVYLAILELLRSAGLTNVMVVRGIAGIDDAGRIHAAGVMTLSVDLPLKIEWVATTERVAELMPSVRKLVKEGVICVQSVGVARLASKRKKNVLDQSVATIMTTHVASVTPATALVDVVTLLMQGGYHSVPVVDEDRKVVGIVTNGDLLRNSSLPIRLGLQPSLTDEQVQSDLRVLQGQNRQVGEIMTMPVTTVLHQQSIRHAGAIMVEKELKRLPVVDEKGVLVGIVSRVDILSALSNRSQIDKVET